LNSCEDSEVGSVSQLVQQWEAQESPAVERIYLDYFPKLQVLARRVLGGLPGASIDAEDAAQSAIKSFCRYMRKLDQPNQKHRDDVWRILCKIAASALMEIPRPTWKP
jgi:DNA-directed RNA polymerase specialized sigma24 family protein